MSKALSLDLRARVVEAIEGGLSCRQAAERFNVSPSSAIRWHRAWRTCGSYAPKAAGGDRLCYKTEAHADHIHAIFEAEADITLREMSAELFRRGIGVSVAALWRYFRRHQITRKKSAAMLRSRPGRTSRGSARPGSRHSSTSIPTA